MLEESYPPISELLPHQPPMILLSALREISQNKATCSATAGTPPISGYDTTPLPISIGVEYMAQTIAAFSGYWAKKRGAPVRRGLVAALREVRVYAESFFVAEELLATVEMLHTDQALSIFQCQLQRAESGALLMEGRITIAHLLNNAE